MLAALTAAPLRGFLVYDGCAYMLGSHIIYNRQQHAKNGIPQQYKKCE